MQARAPLPFGSIPSFGNVIKNMFSRRAAVVYH
jgi:hypothetical protein